jgi:hypothetical protein
MLPELEVFFNSSLIHFMAKIGTVIHGALPTDW